MGGTKPGHDEIHCSTGTTLQPLLPGGRRALALPPLLLVGAVAAVGAAGDSAKHAVMAGIVTGDTADHGAFQAAFGIGGRRRECQRGHGENGEWSSHDAMSPWKAFDLSQVASFRDGPKNETRNDGVEWTALFGDNVRDHL